MALLKAAQAITVKGDNEDQDAGIDIVRKRALQAPIRQIAENAGVEGSIVVGKVLEGRAAAFGYDAQTDEYGDMFEKGIIDPAKVVRTALQDAASIAGLLITTEAGVAEAPKKKEAHATATAAWAAWAAWTCKPLRLSLRSKKTPPARKRGWRFHLALPRCGPTARRMAMHRLQMHMYSEVAGLCSMEY